MFPEDDISHARPWFHRIVQRGRLVFFGMLANTTMLTGLAAAAHAAAASTPAAESLHSVDPMATASTPVVAPLLITHPIRLPYFATETLADRYILLGLMMLCFAAMAAGSLALWRRSLKEMLDVKVKRHGV